MTQATTIEVEILAAVRPLLPAAAADELARWERGELTGPEVLARLRALGGAPPDPHRNGTAVKTDADFRELSRQLRELAEQSPPFDEAAQRADCVWLQSQWGTEELEPYRGTHIAILRGRIVGAAEDSLQLELDLAREYNVHPDQIIIEYVFPRGMRLGVS